ncbi:MAG TPA: TRAP transporter large permease subunit [Burkholderiaceae bacterium]|nr:TRAP transporter large permease subunit [Burkholderiaceae bacterium]
MSDPALGLTMLGMIVVVIMLGFPTAFTLMGLGMVFGFFAMHDPSTPWTQNHIFELMVQRTYGAMVNETLLSIPLFVLMGYVMERGALVDKMFHSVQLAFRRVPGSLAVTTLIICTFWGIASGLVGAVVVLMGVIALRPMLNAGYDVRLASGVITAGGTLGILIPPSVMIIVYAAVAGQSVVKLYASAMFPGFFLAFLYLLYVLGWAILQPKVAPKLPPDQMRAPISPWVAHVARTYSPRMLPALLVAVVAPARALRSGVDGLRISWALLLKGLITALVPLLLAGATLGSAWWYVTIYSQRDANAGASGLERIDSSVIQTPSAPAANSLSEPPTSGLQEPPSGDVREPPGAESSPTPPAEVGLQQLGDTVEAQQAPPVPPAFYTGFWTTCAAVLALLLWYYWKMDAEQFEILRMLVSSVMPLTILTLLVLGVILFGITTATESAALGAAGAFLMAWQAKTLTFQRIKEAVFLTMKTTAMVCWLFVGSALFSAVFALLGGQGIVERWVVGMNLTPVQFLLLSQAIIFILGWPLEWTEIIVIFIPIFLPLLTHFQIDPLLFGTLVFVNLQAAFLSPPVAMSAFYLKGVAPPHVTLNQIFSGMMPYMLIVILCMVIMYIWPGMTLWLPGYLYGQ